MPPPFRGLLLLSSFRQRASAHILSKDLSQFHAAKFITKSKTVPQSDLSHINGPKAHSSQTNSTAAAPDPPQHIRHGFWSWFFSPRCRWFRRVLLSAPVVYLGFLHIPYNWHNVIGPSMAPFFNTEVDEANVKTRIIVRTSPIWIPDTRYGFWLRRNAQLDELTKFSRGQVVTYYTPHEPTKVAVKRIVAVAGDIVQPLPNYPGGDEPIVVPWNHVWIEGDVGDRDKSMDSNWFGPLSQSLILGEVIAVWPAIFQIIRLDWRRDTWPAREDGRVKEDAVAEATLNPNDVLYSAGWRDGSIALVLEKMQKQPTQAITSFVSDPESRQETRRLYNNALFVKKVSSSDQETELATKLAEEMEDLYGRDALVFGIRMKQDPRGRGQLPSVSDPRKVTTPLGDRSVSDAERWLNQQGWELEKDASGVVKTHSTSS